MKITISTDGISDEQKTTEKFISAYDAMLTELSAPGFIPVLCAHEAAHAVYFTLAGMKQFEPQPSRLWYEPAIDDYKGSFAAIKVLDLPPWTPGKFNEWLFRIVCAHAAGGVVARKLAPSSDGGDKDDRERFKLLCDGFNKDPNVDVKFEYWWDLAQKTVAKDLENPSNLAEIETQAAILAPNLGF